MRSAARYAALERSKETYRSPLLQTLLRSLRGGKRGHRDREHGASGPGSAVDGGRRRAVLRGGERLPEGLEVAGSKGGLAFSGGGSGKPGPARVESA